MCVRCVRAAPEVWDLGHATNIDNLLAGSNLFGAGFFSLSVRSATTAYTKRNRSIVFMPCAVCSYLLQAANDLSACLKASATCDTISFNFGRAFSQPADVNGKMVRRTRTHRPDVGLGDFVSISI